MRNTAIYERSNGKCHGYSKTSEKHLKEIFERIQHKEALRFLDIGCGKGVMLKEAAKYLFQRVDGIEIQPQLVKTAQKNFRILKMEDRIQCIPADAVEFEKYGDYNLFFLFNPFPAEILEKVIRKIMQNRNDTDHIATVIYHNPRFLSVIEDNAEIIERETLYDPLKDYETCIVIWDLEGKLLEYLKRRDRGLEKNQMQYRKLSHGKEQIRCSILSEDSLKKRI